MHTGDRSETCYIFQKDYGTAIKIILYNYKIASINA